jgi:hypothetical protein
MRTPLVASLALALVAPAAASVVGARIEPHVRGAWVANGYPVDELDTYRLYVEFDDESDILFAVLGSGDEIVITSSDGTFWNTPVADDVSAPLDLTGVGFWENQWDTYVTIGTDCAEGDATLVTGVIPASDNLSTSFTAGDVAGGVRWGLSSLTLDQGLATGFRVLVAQFTVAEGVDVSGVIRVERWVGDFVDGLAFDGADAGCLTDLDGDGAVATNDLLSVLAAWGPAAGGPPDFDGDGQVAVTDLLKVLETWGACE